MSRASKSASSGDCSLPKWASAFAQSAFYHKAIKEWNKLPINLKKRTYFHIFLRDIKKEAFKVIGLSLVSNNFTSLACFLIVFHNILIYEVCVWVCALVGINAEEFFEEKLYHAVELFCHFVAVVLYCSLPAQGLQMEISWQLNLAQSIFSHL